MNRRELLAAGGALAAVAPAVAATGAPSGASRLVVFDGRYAVCSEIAAAWRADAMADTAAYDIGLLWREQIAPALKRGPTVICGATLHTDFLISRIMARDFQMRPRSFERLMPAEPLQPEVFSWTLA